MKKKYSTLLNFALAGCLATTLVACGSDGDKASNPKSNSESNPQISIGGVVVDTNGNPLSTRVSCQGEIANTNELGQWNINKLRVTNVAGLINDTEHQSVRCVIEAPAGYLGAVVSVYPEAQMDSLYSANAENSDEQRYLPIVTFIDGMYAEAGSAWLPKLGSTVTGRLERCTSEESIPFATVKLDMQAVDNNNPETQAGSACNYGCAVDYSTAMYSATTGIDGRFSIADVPDDSILRLYVEDYTNITMTGDYEYRGSVGDTPDSTPHHEYITTVDEGIINMGDICVDPITAGDGTRPCVVGVTDFVHAEVGEQDVGNSNRSYRWGFSNFHLGSQDIRWVVLDDDTDGTGDGFVIVFNENMNPLAVDENSVVIFNEGPDPDDTSDDDYLTDFAATITGNGLQIVTAVPLGDDDHLKIYMLADDFQDLSGNYLTSDDNRENDVCDHSAYVEDFWSLNDTSYVVVGVKMFSPDDTNVGEVTGLAQQCLDYSAVVSDQTDLQAEYPTTFRSDRTSSDNFYNLNADADYEDRLEALADVLECPTDTTYEANVVPGYASVTFTVPTSGGWEVSSNCYSNCDGPGNGATEVAVIGGGVGVGDTVTVDSLDDFDNVSSSVSVTLGDCVAPTTVLNFAYNTCGHVGYNPSGTNNEFHNEGGDGGPGYDTQYAAHLCVDFEVATLFEYGDGGENTAEGTPGVCGTPTLNITCRLLKDPADAQLGNVDNPITIHGLYDGTDTPPPGSDGPFDDFVLYDATEFAAWVPFTDTIGVAFSEDIQMVSGAGAITWAGSTNITSWAIGNNIGTTDDGNSPDDGEGSSADLVQITVDDVLSLANDDHQQILDFTAVIEDTSGNPADNAMVVINDLMPPFVEYAYWDGGLTIKFNETVAPCVDDLACSADAVVLWETGGGHDIVSLDGATLTDVDGGTDNLLIIPAGNLAGVKGSENFPDATESTWALVYDEQTYDDLGFTPTVDGYAHGALNWGAIPDARGNTWFDYDSTAGPGAIYVDTNDVDLCNMPTFAPANVLGPFQVTSVNVSGGFADSEPNVCAGDTDAGPVTHLMTYTMTHPVSLEKSQWTGESSLGSCPDIGTWCVGVGPETMCTLAEVNSFMNADWVDSCVTFNDTILRDVSALSGVGATLDDDRMGITIEIENGAGSDPCETFFSGDDLDPDWDFWSSFGVGTGKNLGAQSAP